MTHALANPKPIEHRLNVTRLLPWALAAIGILVYINILPNEFVFDDTPAVMRAEIDDLPDLIQTLGGSGRPVADLTIIFNYAIDGDQPMGYHLLNIVIHVLAAMTLFGIVRRLLDLPGWRDRVGHRGVGLAFAIALVWLVHPLNTQAVTYMVQRHESLMGLFYLLTVYATIRCALVQITIPRTEAFTQTETGPGDEPARGWVFLWAGIAIAACLLGMGTKQVMAGAPIVVLLIDRCFLSGSFTQAFRRRWGLYAGLAATWSWLAYLNLGGVVGEEGSAAGFGIVLMTPVEYFLSQGEVIAWYIRLAFWPAPLILDYQVHWLPAAIRARVQGPIAWLPGVALIGALFLVGLYGVIRNRWWGACAAWFFLILGVTSSFLPIVDIAFEHRMYLPLIAIVTLVVIGFDALLHRIVMRKTALSVEVVWVTVVVLTLAILTVQRNFEYATKISVWDSVVVRAPNNPRGWHNLAAALSAANRATEAMVAYEQVLVLNPRYGDAHNGVGNIYMDVHGRPDLAVERYATAVEIKPEDAEYRYNFGRALIFTNQLDESIKQLKEAIALRSDYPRAYNMLGVALSKSNRQDEAVRAYRKAIEQDPESIEAYQNLSTSLAAQKRYAEAAETVKHMLALARQLDIQPSMIKRIETRLHELRQQASQASPQ